jgi:hypothetical protein
MLVTLSEEKMKVQTIHPLAPGGATPTRSLKLDEVKNDKQETGH